MTLEQMYEMSELKTKILEVACQLQSDNQYPNERAIEDLLKIAKSIQTE